jgi:hypothetical protein
VEQEDTVITAKIFGISAVQKEVGLKISNKRKELSHVHRSLPVTLTLHEGLA